MNLDQVDLGKVQAHLGKHGISPLCPTCNKQATQNIHLGSVNAAIKGGGMSIGGGGLTTISLVCDNCGAIRMFDANKVGIS